MPAMTSAAALRAAARRGAWRGTTGGHCPAYQQANLVILPLLPELRSEQVEAEPFGEREYSSSSKPLDREAVIELLRENRLMLEDEPVFAA